MPIHTIYKVNLIPIETRKLNPILILIHNPNDHLSGPTSVRISPLVTWTTLMKLLKK